jgi:putative intracellular protease/amidase
MLSKNLDRRLLLLVAHGTEEIEAVVTADVLRRGQVQVDVASAENTLVVTCSRGVKLVADRLLTDVRNMDDYAGIICPGGSKGADTLASNSRVQEFLRDSESKGKLVALICAGKKSMRFRGLSIHII